MSGTRALRSAELCEAMRFWWRSASLHCTRTPNKNNTTAANACGQMKEYASPCSWTLARSEPRKRACEQVDAVATHS